MAQVKRIMISLPDNLLAEVDGIVAAERLNRSELIREAMRFYIAERKRRQLREQMKKGYQEMAKINRELAAEHYRLDAKTVRQYEKAEVK
ncbi:CopG family transcriptional regulator/antitoxin EndoAI [Desulfofundulus luciae]|uniref:CopG family transcriptional regulator/antitoxin EndoAI n=1 Tax=Desulfofundulus luciae TaxID=74702 RepID=A0ABU0B4G2_9FIRM|nr:ribbon-helix-helix protein, CopG family [Desulfofundulus luciae]MDQ0287403.1 CopG family transcriptional regulator/antitoxin EndoAI [Desulfofundulus luciae]